MNRFIITVLVLYVSVHTGLCACPAPTIAAATDTPQILEVTDFSTNTAQTACDISIPAPTDGSKLVVYLESGSMLAADAVQVTEAAIASQAGNAIVPTIAVAANADTAALLKVTIDDIPGSSVSATVKVRYWKIATAPTACTTGTTIAHVTTAASISSAWPTGATTATCVWYLYSVGKCMTITPVFMDLGTGETLTVEDLSSDGTSVSTLSIGTGPFFTTTATSTTDIVKVTFTKGATSGNGFLLNYVATADTCGSKGAGTSVMASVLLLAASLLGYTFHRYL